MAVNSVGNAVGYCYDNTNAFHAFWYHGGTMTDINATVLGTFQSVATAINDDGVLVGWYQASSTDVRHAFKYDTVTSALSILTPHGTDETLALNISTNGTIGGYWNSDKTWIRSSGGAFTTYPYVPFGASSYSTLMEQIDGKSASGVDDSGSVLVSFDDSSSVRRSAFFDSTTAQWFTPPNFPPAGGDAEARGLNAGGIAAIQNMASGVLAYDMALPVTSSCRFLMTELYPWVVSAGGFTAASSANAINTANMVVGSGHINGGSQAYLAYFDANSAIHDFEYFYIPDCETC
jgi:probable HAF family extracellular repeat protein